VVDRDLGDLVRRRLFELGLSAQDLARRSRGEVSRETIRGLARGMAPAHVSDRLAGSLARALDVTEYRVRKAAGLPVREPFVPRTRPHLRVVRREDPAR
jgi:transcriptional regulator with XRE-family HTH domain